MAGASAWLGELRIDCGIGYRIYYALVGCRVVLLVGGDKRRQWADIATALKYWQDWHEGTNCEVIPPAR